MAIALVTGQHTTGAGQNGTGAMNLSDTTGANLLIGAAAWYAGITTDPTGFTESYSNSYSSGTKQTTATPTSVRISYSNSASPTVGAGHALTISGASLFIAGGFSAWSGANAGASVLDGENGAVNAGQSTLATGLVTPSENNCLVLTALMIENNGGGAISVVDAGWTILDTVAYNGAANEGFCWAYQVQTAATPVNPTWNVTNTATTLAAAIAVFKGPGGSIIPNPTEVLFGQEVM